MQVFEGGLGACGINNTPWRFSGVAAKVFVDGLRFFRVLQLSECRFDI